MDTRATEAAAVEILTTAITTTPPYITSHPTRSLTLNPVQNMTVSTHNITHQLDYVKIPPATPRREMYDTQEHSTRQDDATVTQCDAKA